ncbi:unnamed protein product [Calypogeia fissa]
MVLLEKAILQRDIPFSPFRVELIIPGERPMRLPPSRLIHSVSRRSTTAAAATLPLETGPIDTPAKMTSIAKLELAGSTSAAYRDLTTNAAPAPDGNRTESEATPATEQAPGL